MERLSARQFPLVRRQPGRKRAAHQREAVRSESTRCAMVVRAFALRAGELIVVGCDDATLRLNTGDRIRVNGGRGLVEILDSGSESTGSNSRPE